MSLEFRHIAHAFGDVRALEDISLIAPTGEITCLLGSSGCGKSTLLNLAAGLLPLQQGSVLVGDEVLAEPGKSPPPEARPVGLVFQDGALFPHMTLAKNVGFGLARADQSRASDWLERVGLAGYENRFPHEISGGQQQRAALARAMAPEPQVLLMDEPFASVDIVFRRRLRRDCRRLLKERGTTTVLVTHDPDEAIDIADRIAVMEGGRIVQVGSPADLRERPARASVGAIFGGAQVIAAQQQEGGLRSAFGLWPVDVLNSDTPQAERLELLAFAGNFTLNPDPGGLSVSDIHALGDRKRVVLRAASGEEITVETAQSVEPDQTYAVIPEPGSVKGFGVK